MLKRFFKYVMQSVAGMIGISVYILADTFYISKAAGADGLALLNLVLPVYGLIFAIGSMIGVGSAIWYCIKKSCGLNTDYYFMQSLTFSVIAAIPFFLLGIFSPDGVLKLVGADPGLINLGENYIRIILIAGPVFMMNYTFTAFLRNDNAPTVAMIASISGSAFNIIFDYVFMFPLKMGITGAALATALSPVVTILVCLIHYSGKKNTVGFSWRAPDFKHILKCCKLGIPSFVGEISGAVTAIIFNFLILNIAGNTGVAAYGIIANTALVVISIFNGIAQGAQPLISESYGKKQKNRMKKLLLMSLLLTLVTMVIVIAFTYCFTSTIITIFNSEGNNEMYNYAFTGMRLYSLGFIFASVNILFVTYFAAINKTKQAFFGSVLRGVAAITVSAFVLVNILGLTGIWLSYLCSETVTFIFIGIMLLKMKKENKASDICV